MMLMYKKGLIKMEIDEKNRDSHSVSFTFDALVDSRSQEQNHL